MSSFKRIIFDKLPWQIKYIIKFRMQQGRFPHLFHPQNYTDFIVRDNLFQNHDKHAFMADKYAVRDYVESKGLGRILTKLYGVWSNADDIDFNSLPNEFAIKCNHSCGMNIICPDKGKMDIVATRIQLNQWLKSPHPIFFERHYRKIKPLIICEELIPNNKDGYFPMDYKIHCVKGKAVFIQCCYERDEKDESKMVAYTPSWERRNYINHTIHYSDVDLPRPKHLEEMVRDAELLSSDLEYARIDLYDTDERVIFGEITLTPQGGWLNNLTDEVKNKIGELINKK